jgi:hypothetical protein
MNKTMKLIGIKNPAVLTKPDELCDASGFSGSAAAFSSSSSSSSVAGSSFSLPFSGSASGSADSPSWGQIYKTFLSVIYEYMY